jgi:hypothetical protein
VKDSEHVDRLSAGANQHRRLCARRLADFKKTEATMMAYLLIVE